MNRKKNRHSNALCTLFRSARLVCLAVFLWNVSTPLHAASEILIDDFDGGVLTQNDLGGASGVFTDSTGSGTCATGFLDGGLAITYSRENIATSFSGYFVFLAPGNGTINLLSAGVNQISFKVRGDLANGLPGGAHNFTVDVKDDLGHVLQTPLTNVVGLETGTEEGAFLQVNIPFSAMFPHGGHIDLTRVREVVIVFGHEFTDATAPGTMSRIVIDDLKFTFRANPPEPILDPMPGNPDLDFIAGSDDFDVTFFVGPSDRHVITVAEDPKALRGAALKMYHDLTDSGDFFTFIAFVPSEPIDLAANNIRTLKFRTRHTGFNSGPTKMVLEIKQGGKVRGTVLTYAVGQGPGDADYAETIFPLYSETSTIDEITLVFFDGGDGAFLVDEVSLSSDPYVPANPAYTPSAGPVRSDDELLDYVQSTTAHYFVDQVVGNSLHVRDRSAPNSSSSIAATGFGLSTLTILAERYDPTPGSMWHITDKNGILITPEVAEARAEAILDEFLRIQSLQPSLVTGAGDPDRKYGVAGFFYHFLNEDGSRSGESEVSVIDTAIFLTGAIQAGEYFGGSVKRKAYTLLSAVNWDFVFFAPEKAFRLSWLPELRRGFTVGDPAGIGYLSDGTIGRPTDELLLVNMLALATRPDFVPYRQAFFSYPRVLRTYHSPSGENFDVVNSFFGSAFTYLYAHLYFDFEALGLDRPELIPAPVAHPIPVNWWTNAVAAFGANRQFAIDRSAFFPFSFHENSWGISPVERPDGRYEGLYGGPPAENGPTHDGTVAPHISFGALPFFRTSSHENVTDNPAFEAVRFAYDHFFNDLFSPYGPFDSYNDKAQFADISLGLDQGPIVLSIENYRSRLLWDTFMQNARIQDAIKAVYGHVPEWTALLDQTVHAGEILSFTVSATDTDGDAGIQISSDNLPASARLVDIGNGGAIFSWRPTASDVGVRVLRFWVRDQYRQNPEPLLVNVTVTPSIGEPTASLISPASGPLSGVVTFHAETSDPAGTLYGVLYLDGVRVVVVEGGVIDHAIDTAFFPNGTHKILVRFYYGNSLATRPKILIAGGAFHFENPQLITPEVNIVSPADGSIVSGKVTVTAVSNDPAHTLAYTLTVDNTYIVSNLPAGVYSVATTLFPNGPHQIRIRAYNFLLKTWMEDTTVLTFENGNRRHRSLRRWTNN